MPRRPKGEEDRCPQCLGPGASVENPQFCEFHYHLSQKRIEEVLADDFNGNIVEMVTAIVEMGLERNLLSPYNLQSIVSKRLNARLPFMVVKSTGTANTAASGGGRFNSTQALKRFCREQYKEASQRNPTSVAKPPKNSASKAEFVTWATQNNIDISHFRTRAYRRREAEDGMGNSGSEHDDDDELSDDEYVPSGIPFSRSASPALQPFATSNAPPQSKAEPRSQFPVKSLVTEPNHHHHQQQQQQQPMMMPSAAMFPQPAPPFFLASPIMIPFPKGVPIPTMLPGHMAGVMSSGMMASHTPYVGQTAGVSAPTGPAAASTPPATTPAPAALATADEEQVIQTLGNLY